MLKFCTLICVCNVISLSVGTEVQTTLGRVTGKLVNDATTNASYYSYEGVPYALAPVGSLRFQPPVRIPAWDDVFYATRPGSVCPQAQRYHTRDEMNEDCLTFNVYQPAASSDQLLPVIFVIHGGDFYLQSGKATPIYGPELLILHNVIVVTCNYRLGALGWLSFGTKKLSGNAGLKDVILALKVVHENISKFGGDPNKITIRGSDAGAVITELIMMTNETAGLFQNVMIDCGSVLSPKFMQINPLDNAKALVQELDIPWTNDDEVIDNLLYVNAYDIVKAQEALTNKDPRRGFLTYRPFKPCVETAHENAVLTKQPIDILIEGSIQDVVMYIGFNDQEGLEQWPVFTKEPELLEKIDQNLGLLIPDDISYPKDSEERNALVAQIRQFYLNGEKISSTNMQGYLDMIADTQYTYSTDLFTKLYAARMKSNVYYNIFGLDTELNWHKAYANISYAGASHEDNLGYSFLTSVTRSTYTHLDPSTKEMQENILKITAYFAANGSPPPNPDPWTPTGPIGYHTALSNNGSTLVSSGPIPDRIAFWQSVYNQSRQYTLTPPPVPSPAQSAEPDNKPKGLITGVVDLLGSTVKNVLHIL